MKRYKPNKSYLQKKISRGGMSATATATNISHLEEVGVVQGAIPQSGPGIPAEGFGFPQPDNTSQEPYYDHSHYSSPSSETQSVITKRLTRDIQLEEKTDENFNVDLMKVQVHNETLQLGKFSINIKYDPNDDKTLLDVSVNCDIPSLKEKVSYNINNKEFLREYRFNNLAKESYDKDVDDVCKELNDDITNNALNSPVNIQDILEDEKEGDDLKKEILNIKTDISKIFSEILEKKIIQVKKQYTTISISELREKN